MGMPAQRLLALLTGTYIYFCIRRLLKFYGINGRKIWAMAMAAVPAAMLGGLCLDIWSTGAMVVLHMAALFLLADMAAVPVRAVCKWKGWSNGKIQGASKGGRRYMRCRRLYRCGILPVAAAALLFSYGYYNMNHIRQASYQIVTEKTAGEYRVILMADIHYGTVQEPGLLESKIEEINRLHPDIVILGGDIVEEGTSGEAMREVFRLLGSMESRYGIYYVYGNHDRQPYTEYRTFTDDELIQSIEAEGIRILRDEYVEIGDGLILAGREDAMIARYVIGHIVAPEEILQGADMDKFIIIASHEPAEAEACSGAGADLLVAGHTHAGQLWPVGIVNGLTGTLNYGEYQRGGCHVIVTSGVSGWGYPIRTQGHCEYAVIDIVGAKDGFL